MHRNITIDFFKFPLKCMIGLLFFLPFLNKREKYIIVLAVDVVVCSALLYVLNKDVAPSVDSVLFMPYAAVFFLFLIIAYFAFQNSAWTILFCGGVILATQQIAFNIWILFYGFVIYPLVAPVSAAMEILMYVPEIVICAGTFWIVYCIFLRKLEYHDEIMKSNKTVIFIVGILVLAIFIVFQSMGSYVTGWMVYVYAYLFVLAGCILADGFVFSVVKENKMEIHLQVMHQILQQKEAQFKLSKSNIELINQKCHNMKYILKSIQHGENSEEIQAAIQTIGIYDAIQKTGNDILDVVLTEYLLMCEQKKIVFTTMIDGKLLDFIKDVDLYTLFGNILENATEECMNIDDVDKRYIILNVAKHESFVAIHAENSCFHKVTMKDGFPETSKEDKENHGFGVKSIGYITDKYGGGISINMEHAAFMIDIFLPLLQSDDCMNKEL